MPTEAERHRPNENLALCDGPSTDLPVVCVDKEKIATVVVEPVPDWPKDAVRDRLIGDWYIYQRTGGHRTGTDDLITAWYAVHRNDCAVERYLDLGCGVGSVLFMVCHTLKPRQAVGLEAQAQSAAMAARALSELPGTGGSAVQIRHGDFRYAHVEDQAYDLITGTPPYFPFHTGVLPKDLQRRDCRFEARGGVETYCQAAARALSPCGRFYLVFPSASHKRVVAAATASGLYRTGQADFRMREDRQELFLSVYDLRLQPLGAVHRVEHCVRDCDGQFTAGYQELRRELGVA